MENSIFFTNLLGLALLMLALTTTTNMTAKAREPTDFQKVMKQGLNHLPSFPDGCVKRLRDPSLV